MRVHRPAFTRLRAAAMTIELWAMLWIAEAMIRLLPYRRYARLVQAMNGSGDAPLQQARRVRRRLDVAARWLPWQPLCLVRAIAARAILGRRGFTSILSLGVDIAAADLAAHAWLTAGGIIVTGRDEIAAHREVTQL